MSKKEVAVWTDGVAGDQIKMLSTKASLINQHIETAFIAVSQMKIDVGGLLIEAKANFKDEAFFTMWRETNTAVKSDTDAKYCMQAHRLYADGAAYLTKVGWGAARELISAPQSVKDEVKAKVEAGEDVSVKDVKKAKVEAKVVADALSDVPAEKSAPAEIPKGGKNYDTLIAECVAKSPAQRFEELQQDAWCAKIDDYSKALYALGLVSGEHNEDVYYGAAAWIVDNYGRLNEVELDYLNEALITLTED